MSRLVLFSIVAIYLTIGIFVAGIIDDATSLFVVLFWPVLIICLALLATASFVYHIGKLLGDIIFGR